MYACLVQMLVLFYITSFFYLASMLYIYIHIFLLIRVLQPVHMYIFGLSASLYINTHTVHTYLSLCMAME